MHPCGLHSRGPGVYYPGDAAVPPFHTIQHSPGVRGATTYRDLQQCGCGESTESYRSFPRSFASTHTAAVDHLVLPSCRETYSTPAATVAAPAAAAAGTTTDADVAASILSQRAHPVITTPVQVCGVRQHPIVFSHPVFITHPDTPASAQKSYHAPWFITPLFMPPCDMHFVARVKNITTRTERHTRGHLFESPKCTTWVVLSCVVHGRGRG